MNIKSSFIEILTGVVIAFAVPAFAQEHAGHQHGSKPTTTTPSPQPAAQTAPVITLSPDKVQLIGVRTATADFRPLDKQIRTVGKVEPDETRLAFVNTKIAGWVKKLSVDYTGKEVVKGQPLLSIYSPDLVTAQEEYLILESAKRRLQLWDITDEQIAELEKTGKPRTEMTIEAPLSGIVLEKMVLEGAYITPGMNLYRIADLSSVWIMADI